MSCRPAHWGAMNTLNVYCQNCGWNKTESVWGCSDDRGSTGDLRVVKGFFIPAPCPLHGWWRNTGSCNPGFQQHPGESLWTSGLPKRKGNWIRVKSLIYGQGIQGGCFKMNRFYYVGNSQQFFICFVGCWHIYTYYSGRYFSHSCWN